MADDLDISAIESAVSNVYGKSKTSPSSFPVISPSKQKGMDQDAINVLQAELEKERKLHAAGDTRAAANIAGLEREIKSKGGIPSTNIQEENPMDISGLDAAVTDVYKTPPQKPVAKNPLASAGRSVAGLADTVLGNIQSFPGAALAEVGYAGVRGLEALGLAEPGRAKRGKAAIYKQFVEPYTNPVGQTFGVTETPEYKGEASQQAMKFVAQNMDKGADYISKQTGLPKADVENMMATIAVGVGGKVGNVVGKGVNKAIGVAETAVEKSVNAVKASKERVLPSAEMQEQFARKKLGYGQQNQAGLSGVGAAQVTSDAQIAQLSDAASPQLKAHIQSLGNENINVPALETKLLEEKHGIDLTQGQRTNNTPQYSKEWNNRGAHPNTLGAKFEGQPEQFVNALDKVRDQVAPYIYESNPSELGQKIINGFVEKDNLRKQNIDRLYGDLQTKYNEMRQQNGLAPTEHLPIDGNNFVQAAKQRLTNELLTHDAESAGITKFLDGIESNGGNMTFQDYLTLDRRLSAKMREGKGSERAAAYEVRQALQNMELTADAQALTPLLNKAKAAAAERFQTIKDVPGYKQAIGEATSAQDAAEGIGSANADTFHNKHISRGSPADVKRILRELGEGSEAHQAMRVAELNNIKEKSGFKGEKANFTPNGMNDYLHGQREKLRDIFGVEGTTALHEINLLGSKIAQPKTGTFNYSNTLSGYLAEAAKEGIVTGIEGLAAAHTGGKSLLVTKPGREWFANAKNRKFGEKSVNPYAGISNKD
jgi:hypothetical protein